jgi:aminomethyltransferase
MSQNESLSPPVLNVTPLHALHVRLHARMAGFAGWDMPIQYADGLIAEHKWTRQNAGLFDVSHMGQIILEGAGAIAALERLVAADIADLAENRTRYAQFLNNDGGIIDDLMVTRLPAAAGIERLFLVVNAGRKAVDVAHLAQSLQGSGIDMQVLNERALIALQGPRAVEALKDRLPGIEAMAFMSFMTIGAALITRSGYTGEDGYEISLPASQIDAFANDLLDDERVKLAGLGARDSLRLEAGLCLYGHDIDESTSPVEAGLAWSIGKRRRIGGGFAGAERILRELRDGPARKRIGLLLEGRQPAREGAQITTTDGEIVGVVTSGSFAPSLERCIAMGYVALPHAGDDTQLHIIVRGKALPARIVPMPFVPHNYIR